MSIYDHRDRPAYTNDGAQPHYCKNPHILQWWTPSHDKVLAKQIKKEQWVWYWDVTDKIVAITDPDIIEICKLVDPLCSKYALGAVLPVGRTQPASGHGRPIVGGKEFRR